MSMKLKALGLGILAMMAVGAFAVTNAGATVSGHFEFGSEHTFITGEEEGLDFVADDGSKIGCDEAKYTGTHKGTKTTTELTITPSWNKCYTTPTSGAMEEPTWDVDENGCHLVFTSRALPAENDATVHVICPSATPITITHPNCNITVDPQTIGGEVGNGVTYTGQNDGTPWVTLDVKVKVAATYHTGLCIFLGTNHTATMVGSVKVKGYSNAAHTVRTAISAT